MSCQDRLSRREFLTRSTLAVAGAAAVAAGCGYEGVTGSTLPTNQAPHLQLLADINLHGPAHIAAYFPVPSAVNPRLGGNIISVADVLGRSGVPDLVPAGTGLGGLLPSFDPATLSFDIPTQTDLISAGGYSPLFNYQQVKSILVATRSAGTTSHIAEIVAFNSALGVDAPCFGVANGAGADPTWDAYCNRHIAIPADDSLRSTQALDVSVFAMSGVAGGAHRFRSSGMTNALDTIGTFATDEGNTAYLRLRGDQGVTQVPNPVYAVIVLGGQWTVPQATAFERWARDHISGVVNSARVPTPFPFLGLYPRGPLNYVDYNGDSITAGFTLVDGPRQKFASLLQPLLGASWAFAENGVVGISTAAMAVAAQPLKGLNALNSDNIVVVQEGTNDLVSLNLDYTKAVNQIIAYCQTLWDAGYKPIVWNMLKGTDSSRIPGWNAARLAYNALLSTQWKNGAFGLFDTNTIPELQAASSDAGNAYFSDGLHPNQAGHVVIANALLPVIQQVHLVPWQRRV